MKLMFSFCFPSFYTVTELSSWASYVVIRHVSAVLSAFSV